MAPLTTLSFYALLGLASAAIVKKPLVKDAINEFTEEFEAILKPQKFTKVKWSAEDIERGVPTDDGWSEALGQEGGQSYCKDQLSVYNVTYADCPEPWVIGHCAKAEKDLEATINLIGGLPSNFRAGISDLLHTFLPNHAGYIGGGGSSAIIAGAFQPGDAIEIGVRTAIFGKGVTGNDYADAVAADTCVADETSASDIGKATPEYGGPIYRTGMLIAYQKLVGKLPMDASCMKNQMDVVAPFINERLNAKGKCPNKAVPNIERMYTLLFPDGIEVLNEIPVPSPGKPIVDAWEPGSYPEFCWNEASSNRKGSEEPRCAPKNLSVYNVTYPDCDQDPWAVCHCSDAQVPLDELIENFGRVPPALRSYVKNVMGLDGTNGDGDVQTWAAATSGGFMIFGECTDSVYFHESAHCIDREFHSDPKFVDAKAQDSCVPTSYAKTSDTELFAELSGAYIYDKNSKSLKERGFDQSCMANQMKAVGDYVGEEYTLSTSKCFKREADKIVTPGEANTMARVKPHDSKAVPEDFVPKSGKGGKGGKGGSNVQNVRFF